MRAASCKKNVFLKSLSSSSLGACALLIKAAISNDVPSDFCAHQGLTRGSRMRCVLAAWQFCPVLCIVYYPTRSISEAQEYWTLYVRDNISCIRHVVKHAINVHIVAAYQM